MDGLEFSGHVSRASRKKKKYPFALALLDLAWYEPVMYSSKSSKCFRMDNILGNIG